MGMKRFPLSRKEFALLQALVCHPGKLVMQTQLLNDIWGAKPQGRYPLPAHRHCQPAQEAGDNPSNPVPIETEPGIGYRFIDS